MPHSMRGKMTCLAVAALLPWLVWAPSAAAQIPDEFTNLEVLDPEIGKPALLETMKGFALGLGVRCNHCHVGPDNLQGMDFATDEKATKRAARRMLEMVSSINSATLADLPTLEEGETAAQVTCYSCHRGQAEPPRHLVDVLTERAGTEGPEAALDSYRKLREEHYGAGRYDFSEETLSRVARTYVEAREYERALTILDGAEDFYPGSPSLATNRGMVHFAAGDLEAARASFAEAIRIDPDFEMARQALARLEAMMAETEESAAEEEP